MAGREDFKTLVGRCLDGSDGRGGVAWSIAAGALQSRFGFGCWSCALTSTLAIDEDGCYDPADFNDGLLLGLKGTMAQAELHFLHARLQGGKLNKARKGELCFPLPVGFCYDGQSCIVFDPDEEVRGAVGLVFSSLSRNGHGLCRDATIRRKHVTISQAQLWWSLGWQDHMGRLTHSRVLTHSQESVLCRKCTSLAVIKIAARSALG